MEEPHGCVVRCSPAQRTCTMRLLQLLFRWLALSCSCGGSRLLKYCPSQAFMSCLCLFHANVCFLTTEPCRNAQRTTAMFLQNSWLTSLLSTDLTERQKDALLVGDSFDADGLSTSNMTFTLETAQVRSCSCCASLSPYHVCDISCSLHAAVSARHRILGDAVVLFRMVNVLSPKYPPIALLCST